MLISYLTFAVSMRIGRRMRGQATGEGSKRLQFRSGSTSQSVLEARDESLRAVYYRSDASARCFQFRSDQITDELAGSRIFVINAIRSVLHFICLVQRTQRFSFRIDEGIQLLQRGFDVNKISYGLNYSITFPSRECQTLTPKTKLIIPLDTPSLMTPTFLLSLSVLSPSAA